MVAGALGQPGNWVGKLGAKPSNCRVRRTPKRCQRVQTECGFAAAQGNLGAGGWGEHRKSNQALIHELPLPQLQIEQLKNLQIEVFPAGEVGINYAAHFFRSKQAALPHSLL